MKAPTTPERKIAEIQAAFAQPSTNLAALIAMATADLTVIPEILDVAIVEKKYADAARFLTALGRNWRYAKPQQVFDVANGLFRNLERDNGSKEDPKCNRIAAFRLIKNEALLGGFKVSLATAYDAQGPLTQEEIVAMVQMGSKDCQNPEKIMAVLQPSGRTRVKSRRTRRPSIPNPPSG